MHAEKNFQTDEAFVLFLGNLSELLYDKSKSNEATQVVKQARDLAWAQLRARGLQVDSMNFNSKTVLLWEDRKKVAEEDLETALAAAGGSSGAPAGGGKPGSNKDAKKPAKGAPVEEEKVEDAPNPDLLDFSKTIDYKLAGAEYEANSGTQELNLYYAGLSSLIRLDLRYAQYLSLLEKSHHDAKLIL